MKCANCGRRIVQTEPGDVAPGIWMHQSEPGEIMVADCYPRAEATPMVEDVILRLTREELEALLVLTEAPDDDPDVRAAQNYAIVSLPETPTLAEKVEAAARELGLDVRPTREL